MICHSVEVLLEGENLFLPGILSLLQFYLEWDPQVPYAGMTMNVSVMETQMGLLQSWAQWVRSTSLREKLNQPWNLLEE